MIYSTFLIESRLHFMVGAYVSFLLPASGVQNQRIIYRESWRLERKTVTKTLKTFLEASSLGLKAKTRIH